MIVLLSSIWTGTLGEQAFWKCGQTESLTDILTSWQISGQVETKVKIMVAEAEHSRTKNHDLTIMTSSAHVTSSGSCPIDSSWALSYRLSVGSISLSGFVSEIFSPKDYSWACTRGAQLTAGYTVNTYSKPPLYYTLGALAPLLPCSGLAALSCCAYARHTHSCLAALCRTRTDRRATDTTYQPANQPTNQPAVLPVPSCKLGTRIMGLSDGVHFTIPLSLC